MDFIDKRIFLKNFQGHLRGHYIVDTLKRITSEIELENDLKNTNTTTNEENIRDLKQIIWLLEKGGN